MAERRVYAAAEEPLRKFGTDPAGGLTLDAVRKSRETYGANRLTPPEKDPLWKQYLEKFTDPTIIILCACAVIAFGVGVYRGEMPWDGVAVLVAVMLATTGSTWSEYKANKAFELLKQDSDSIPVKLTRGGQFHTVVSGELVAGDLIHIEGGDRIPADAVLLHSVDLMIDQSLWNGESKPAHKGSDDPELVGGTFAVTGSGVAVVTAVGDGTKLGNLASALGKGFACPDRAHRKVYKEEGKCEVCGQALDERKEPDTPLQEKLAGLAGQISVWGWFTACFIFLGLFGAAVFAGKLGDIAPAWRTGLGYFVGAAAALTAVLLALRLKGWTRTILWGAIAGIGGALVLTVVVHLGGRNFLDVFKLVLDYFMVAVTIVVVAVPEGLPMAVFIALGFGMRKIRQDNNLVRKMLAVETIGSATVICCDKTGTLTKNQMEVHDVYLDGRHLTGRDVLSAKDTPSFELLSAACAVNSTAEVEHTDGQVRFVGNRTEGALLLWLERMGLKYQDIRERMPIHSRVCFTADRKMMTTLTGNDACTNCASCPVDGIAAEASSVCAERDGCRLVFTKGAPERVVPLCTHAHVAGGQVRPIAESQKQVGETIEAMARKAVRPLAIAYRLERRGDVPSSEDAAKGLEGGLTLLAVVGMTDPVREDVPEALRTCRSAGIDVKMITGDHPATAEAVAREIEMLGRDDVVLRREEFAAKSDEEVKALLPRLRVLSRAEPDDKRRLVELLQEQGHVVAVTGDGTNDAPALERANVGIAMGQRGTDVAKEASDIVLTDDNFGSIVRAVHWGRTLYENIQKFLQFQLTVNLSALGVALISPIVATLFPNIGFQVMPLTVLQYLWINLIMDTLAALAFGLEPPRPEAMSTKPRDRNEPFLTRTMLMNVIVLGGYFIGLLLLLQATDLLGVSKLGLGEEAAKAAAASVVFNSYVWFQIFHMFNARSVIAGRSAFTGITQSRSFFYVMGFVIVIQFLFVQFGGHILHTVPLPPLVWVKIILLGSTALVVGEALRFVQRRMLARGGRPVAAAASASA